jgi:hypothetical protein
VAALDHPERVEGLHHRDAERPGRGQRRLPGHPEVGVDHVGRPGRPAAEERAGEVVHVGEQGVLGQRARRPGVDVLDSHPVTHRHPVGEGGVVPPGVDRHLEAAALEGEREGGDVDVLAAGVDGAERGQRAGVLGDQGDAQRAAHRRVTSSSSRSQSARKRLAE